MIKLKRLAIFSSGVGFYQHSGEIDGNESLVLPFNKNAVNDALKSLLVSDPDASPTVSYHSENTLQRTMKGLSIDLQGKNHIAALLNSLKGAEVEVFTPSPIKGRIMFVENRYSTDAIAYSNDVVERESYLSLFTSEGIRVISLKEIARFAFTDSKINEDVTRALDLILQSRDSDTRNLTVNLPGHKQRNVSLSYVIPMPIWKASYRLDLEKGLLQGWAIVDNDSDMDWENLELSLVTGKPVSFIQNLYAPYHTSRPTLPLSIVGVAEAQTYESGTSRPKAMAKQMPARPIGGNVLSQSNLDAMLCSMSYEEEPELSVEDLIVSTQIEEYAFDTADGRLAGDQFEFTIKTPVSLARQQSTMLPLVEATVKANKQLVFSGNKASRNIPMNPALAVELVNDTGTGLPAGPITVYDNTYAGDALIAFFPEGEKRIVSYGEDLTVTGSFASTSSVSLIAVSIKDGVMTSKRQATHERVYTFKNASNDTKRLIVEHPITRGAELVEPCDYAEKTSNLYRFELDLPPGETVFTVREDELLLDELTLSGFSFPDFVHFVSNQETPEAVCTAFKKAMTLREKIGNENAGLTDAQKKLARLLEEQDRTRKNLAAAGSQTQQGQNYLTRLVSQDTEIDAAHVSISTAEQAVKTAEQEYQAFLKEMYFE